MIARKFIYNVDYTHILTFKEYYKKLVYPYFAMDSLQYAIDSENTINESIRLIYPSSYSIQLRKEGITLMFEGDTRELKRQNPVIDTFLSFYESISKIPEFTKIVRHKIAVDFVEIMEEQAVQLQLGTKNTFVKSPFSDLSEFAVSFEFKRGARDFTVRFGNYSEKDITKFNLSPFKADFNKDLIGKVGLMGLVSVQESTSSVSFSKFKDILREAEDVIGNYRKIYEQE